MGTTVPLNTSYYDYSPEYDSQYDVPCNLDETPAVLLAQTYLYSFICACGLLGNTLVIVTYMFYKKTKTMTDIYLFNVVVADLLFIVALPFIAYNERRDWPMGVAACKGLRAAYSVNLYSCMLLLACISCDRYAAIVRARRYFGAEPTRMLKCGRLVCTAVWVAAAALSLPTLVYTDLVQEEDQSPGEGEALETAVVTCQLFFQQDDTAKLMKILVPSLQITFGFLLPLLVMNVCYCSVVCALLRAQSSRRHKAIRVVLAVVAVFVLCHLPYNVALMHHTLSLFQQRGCEAERAKLRALAVSRSVAYLHCCLNPVLYAFVGVKFRGHFRQIVVDLGSVSKKYICSCRPSRQPSDAYAQPRVSSDGVVTTIVPSFSA